jgi:hypothetical protein
MVQLVDRRPESTLPREGADVQLIQHDLVPRAAGPALCPLVAVRIDHLAGAMHVLRLET